MTVFYDSQFPTIESITAALSNIKLPESPALSALDAYIKGKNIDPFLNQLDSLFSGKEQKKAHELPLSDLQAIILLLTLRFSELQDPSDFCLILRALPYYVTHLKENSSEPICGIVTEEVIDALACSNAFITLALRNKAEETIQGCEDPTSTKGDDWRHLVSLLARLTREQKPDVTQTIAWVAEEWARNTGCPDDALCYMLNTLGEFSYALGEKAENRSEGIRLKQEALIEEFCTVIEADSFKRASLLIGCHNIKGLLLRAKNGTCDHHQMSYIASILFNEVEGLHFSDFYDSEKLAAILAMHVMWQKTKRPEYLELIFFAAPYVLNYIDIVFPDAFLASKVSLDEVVDAFLTQEYETTPHYPGSGNFKRFMRTCSSELPTELFSWASSLWYNQTGPNAHSMTCTLRDLAECTQLQPQAVRNQICGMLTDQLIEGISPRFILEVLYVICNGKGEATAATLLNMSEKMPDCRERRVFIRAINSKRFPEKLRAHFIAHYLRKKSTDISLSLAASLASWLSFEEIRTLLTLMNSQKEPGTAFREFSGRIHTLSSEMIPKVTTLFLEFPDLIDRLTSEIENNPRHQGTDLLVDIVECEGFDPKKRKALQTSFAALPDTLHICARLLTPEEQDTINYVCEKLLNRLVYSPECPSLATFFKSIDSGEISDEIRYSIIHHALQKYGDLPATLLLIARMSPYLTISELWNLLHRLEINHHTYSPLLSKTLQHVLQTRWILDQNGPDTWCPNSRFTIHDMHNTWTTLIIERIELLKKRFNVVTEVSLFEKMMDNVIRRPRNFAKARSEHFKMFKAHKAAHKPQPARPLIVPPLVLPPLPPEREPPRAPDLERCESPSPEMEEQ